MTIWVSFNVRVNVSIIKRESLQIHWHSNWHTKAIKSARVKGNFAPSKKVKIKKRNFYLKVFMWKILIHIYAIKSEPEFVNLLRSPGIDNPICRTGPQGYIGWRNRFLGSLKGQCHEIFDIVFFSWFSFPQAPEYPSKAVTNFFENLRRYSQLEVHHRCRWQRWQLPLNKGNSQIKESVQDSSAAPTPFC